MTLRPKRSQYAILIIVLSLFMPHALYGRDKSTQDLLYERVPQALRATLPIACWSDFKSGPKPPVTLVVGTGFLINDQGYFLTAAHVTRTDNVGGTPCGLKAIIKQADGNGSAMPFDIIETDVEHDLTLARIRPFDVHDAKHLTKFDLMGPRSSLRPFASLEIDTTGGRQGEMVILSGFPLGSEVQAMHLGVVSATSTLYTNSIRFSSKYWNELMQVTIDGNHGDSGGPLIDLSTGKVVGILLQIVPAPIAINGLHQSDNTFTPSGIMLAAPASWINALLARNHVTSHSQLPGNLYIY